MEEAKKKEAEGSFVQAAEQLEKTSGDLKILEDNYGEAYNNGYDMATKDFEDQIPDITRKIWASYWKRCLEQAGVHEDSPLGTRPGPEGLDILMTPTEVDIGNGGIASDAVMTEVADPGQKEAEGSTPTESPLPAISTVRPTQSG